MTSPVQVLEQGRSTTLVEGAGVALRLLRTGRARTLTELASALGVSRSTAQQRLTALRDVGLVDSEAATSGARGRPAAITTFNPAAGVVLAAHVGLTGSRIAATDLRGDVLGERFVPTDLRTGAQGITDALAAAFDEMLPTIGMSPVAGVGLALPSAGELLGWSRTLGLGELDWERSTFVDGMRRHFQVPVFVDLDVNLLALAERRTSWPEAEVVVSLKLGTLIDAAIVVNNVPIRGRDNLAGELGHIKVNGSTEPCTCGGVGCLDATASGSALVRSLSRAGFDVEQVADVVALAKRGEPAVVSAVREAGRAIGEALAAAVNILNPSVIVAWGYLTEVEVPLFAGMREGLYQKALPGASKDLVLETSSVGDLAGVRGAATLVLDEVLDPAAVDRMLAAGSWSAGAAGGGRDGAAPDRS